MTDRTRRTRGTTTADRAALAAAKLRHPAGKKLGAAGKALTVAALGSALLVTGAGVASADTTPSSAAAHSRLQHPDTDPGKDRSYVGPTRPKATPYPSDSLGAYGVAGLGLFALFFLI